MNGDPEALAVIAGMAAVTYLTRIGGPWLMSRIRLSEPVKDWLGHIPGPVLVSLVAPAVVKGGTEVYVGASFALLGALITKSLPLSMALGVGAVAILRYLI